MRTIRVDDRVYEHLQRHARPFEDTPNDVLVRLLGIDDQAVNSESTRTPPTPRPRHDRTRPVARMRQDAVDAIESALSARDGRPVTIQQDARAEQTGKRGPREQRFVTPGGQVIYIRTRSYDAAKLPFFTMQPSTLTDADWYVFVCDGRGDVVMSGDELRRLSDGLHRDAGGDFKPTFIVDGARCEIYANGEPTPLPQALDAYELIASREPGGG